MLAIRTTGPRPFHVPPSIEGRVERNDTVVERPTAKSLKVMGSYRSTHQWNAAERNGTFHGEWNAAASPAPAPTGCWA